VTRFGNHFCLKMWSKLSAIISDKNFANQVTLLWAAAVKFFFSKNSRVTIVVIKIHYLRGVEAWRFHFIASALKEVSDLTGLLLKIYFPT
jgi:hypothetical protein